VSTTPDSPNLFDTPSGIPSEPVRLRAGDSWKWTTAFDGYSPADGWTLKYVFNAPEVARVALPDDSAQAGTDGSFDVTVPASATTGITPGTYDIYAILVNGSEQRTIELESVAVLANIAGATSAADTRSFAKKTLDAIEAAIAGDTSPHVQEYEIHGRRVRYMERALLLQYRAQFKVEYRNEQIAAGKFVPKTTARIEF